MGKGGNADPEAGRMLKADSLEPEAKKAPFVWRSNWLKHVLFLEVDPLVLHGYKTRLEPEDVYQEPKLLTKSLNAEFEPAWEAQRQRPEPSLKRAILAGNVSTLLVSGMLYGIAQATSLAGPILLQRIVKGIACQAYGGAAPGCEPQNNLYL